MGKLFSFLRLRYLLVILVAATGVFTVLALYAKAAPSSTETEAGARSGNSALVADTSASGSQAVKFNAPTGGGGFQANCISVPSSCGYPDATNTGVPTGTTLTNSGSITVNTNGAVVQNLNITGQITINANNVTIRNVRITSGDYYPIYYNGNTGLLVEDTEINATDANATACMSFENYTARRVKCSGASDGFKANANVVIEDSYIFGLRTSSGSHNDGVQTTGGSNVRLTHNTIDLRGIQAEIIQFGVEWASNSNWTIDNNLIAGGGWVFNAGNDVTPNTVISNNRFAGTRVYGIAAPNGSTRTNNYYDANGNAVCFGGGC